MSRERDGGDRPRGTSGDKPDGSFEDRLGAARRRQGLEGAGGDSGRGLSPVQGNALGMGLRVGVELARAFLKANTNRSVNRVLLSRFVTSIAA